MLLVRRSGVGKWLLVEVDTVPAADAVTYTVPDGGGAYVPQPGDTMHLVEAYWAGMVSAGLSPMRPERERGGGLPAS